MTLVYVVCEGQTEETFVRDVLWQAVEGSELTLIGQTIETSVGHKGGALKYDRVKRHLRNQLRASANSYVTTLFDLYRLDPSFPGFERSKAQNGLDRRLAALGEAFHADVVDAAGCRPERFIPYLQPYEFEALLFSDVPALTSTERGWVDRTSALQAVRDAASSPESINERPGNNPAAHLQRELTRPNYKKTLHGPAIAKNIGISRIESECSFFAGWIARLRGLT
jgi:hypothetical protein